MTNAFIENGYHINPKTLINISLMSSDIINEIKWNSIKNLIFRQTGRLNKLKEKRGEDFPQYVIKNQVY